MKVFKQQHWHLISLLILLFGLYYVVQENENILQGQLWGLSTISARSCTLCCIIQPSLYLGTLLLYGAGGYSGDLWGLI